MKPIRTPVLRIYGAPLLIAVVSGAGLVAALVADGAVDAVFAAGVAAPLAVAAWALKRRRR